MAFIEPICPGEQVNRFGASIVLRRPPTPVTQGPFSVKDTASGLVLASCRAAAAARGGWATAPRLRRPNSELKTMGEGHLRHHAEGPNASEAPGSALPAGGPGKEHRKQD